MTDAERQQLADKIAELNGWTWIPAKRDPLGVFTRPAMWVHPTKASREVHPYLIGDLTAIAGALPQGWKWRTISTPEIPGWCASCANGYGKGSRNAMRTGPDEWQARALAVKAAFEKEK